MLSLSRRSLLLAIVNLSYFWSVLIGAFVAQIHSLTLYELPLAQNVFAGFSENPFLLMAVIFLFNLAVSGFSVTTFPGLGFFVLSFLVVLWRALLWGVLLAQLPTPQFLWVIPTLVLEGEAYVIAAVAGIILGLSWVKPDWAFRGQNLSRKQAFTNAIIECGRFYVWVVVLLLLGAAVETVTVVYGLRGLHM